jgi:hypothetical protein
MKMSGHTEHSGIPPKHHVEEQRDWDGPSQRESPFVPKVIAPAAGI